MAWLSHFKTTEGAPNEWKETEDKAREEILNISRTQQQSRAPTNYPHIDYGQH
jgi:uncharacterized protein (DUF2461 family)